MIDGQCKCGGDWIAVSGEERLVTCDKCNAMMGWDEKPAPPEVREPVDRETAREQLDRLIAEGEREKSERKAKVEQIKWNMKECLLYETITAVNFDENGYLLSIEVSHDTRLRPTSDSDDESEHRDNEDWERGDGHWLRIEGEA